ncbi:MAG: 23S rRNA (pseudouridine(1915)-N(3))-methyltransferase RlmH [Candidatus Cloacimonadaceae bacterium]|nr:23S rRNA (pseudouridine(1915)-N(3))-methyltransferase RlmH [Candidatus Cloacimonadaceae bacterium]MDP3114614.1 23S rRNA (pseudouridine(1915)-N(3))-methyltransferase RlmH [Candidatus Cloacimonadaceae bacterium]
MNLRIYQIGKTKEDWLKAGIDEYLKRLGAFLKVEIIELPDVSLKSTGCADIVKARETQNVLKRISPDEYLILLDESGVQKSSLEFSRYLTNLYERKSVVFVIGGVFGTDNALKQRADLILSLSAMTFTHQMVRLVLIEQIYRAMMISHNRNYHI